MGPVVSMGVREQVCAKCAGRLYAHVAYCPYCSAPQGARRRDVPAVIARVGETVRVEAAERRTADQHTATPETAAPDPPLADEKQACVQHPPDTASTTNEQPVKEREMPANGQKPLVTRPLFIAVAVLCLAAVSAAAFLLWRDSGTAPSGALSANPPGATVVPTPETKSSTPPDSPKADNSTEPPPTLSDFNTGGRPPVAEDSGMAAQPGITEEQRQINLQKHLEETFGNKSGGQRP